MNQRSIAPELLRLDADGPTLLGGWSATSGQLHFPLQPVCPYTGADDVVAVDLPGTGTIWLWTTVHSAPPGYHGPVPYHLGIVELDVQAAPVGAADRATTALRLVTRLLLGGSEPTVGAPVRLTTEAVGGNGVDDSSTVVWAFEVLEVHP